jgi:AraC-like DNA-binding protein
MGTAEQDVVAVGRAAAPALAGVVDGYHGYRLAGFPPGLHRGAPSRRMTFIVAVGPPIDVVQQTDRRQAPRAYRAVLSGLQQSEALIAHDGFQEGVAIELSPLGCRTLFGLPARALWDTSVELDEVVGAVGAELADRIQSTDDWEQRFAACDDVLIRLLHAGPSPRVVRREVDPTLGAAWARLVATGGRLAVGDLAEEVGWSRQHLRARFVDELGLTPKVAARVIRFERARRLLLAGGPFGAVDAPGEAPIGEVGLADIAAHCGYTDQSHLTREFVALVGCPPGRLLAEELPSVQDDQAVAGAG